MLANYAEKESFGVGFHKIEINKETSNGVTTTTVYSGRTSLCDVKPETEAIECWEIRRNVIEDNGTHQLVTETWANGSWVNRANLTYKYMQ